MSTTQLPATGQEAPPAPASGKVPPSGTIPASPPAASIDGTGGWPRDVHLPDEGEDDAC